MSTIGERIKEERERLGLNQTVFAEKGGVQRRAQMRYESNQRSPDGHYLSRIVGAGADVAYILTGIRSVLAEDAEPAVVMDMLSPKEKAMLDMFRTLDERAQYEVQVVAKKEKQFQELKQTVAELQRKAG